MQYESVIGLEIHAQMLTETKVFCGCLTQFGAGPNSQTCPVCTGLPGVLPALNKKAVEFAVRTGLAMNSEIAPLSRFARKNYFYPDLPKGYQISQYELPICTGGFIELVDDGTVRKIGITRIHMEEDAGKNIHAETGNWSYVDLNRAGVPLMEIVSEPDIRYPKEAVAYMKKLRSILCYIGVCDGNMEQGSLRCDANVSVREIGTSALGTKVEVKNINSFRFVERALQYEIKRQTKLLKEGGRIIQETRLWDSQTGTTQPMRTKEEAHDYRYFPEPDLAPVIVKKAWIDEIRVSLPELPDRKRQRFISEYRLPDYDADFLTEERPLADWYEEALRQGGQPKAVSNWVMGELMRLLNEQGMPIEKCPLRPERLVEMLQLIEKGTISGKLAKTVFEEMFQSGKDAETVVREKGLVQITDDETIAKAVAEVMDNNPDEVARFKSGEEKLIGFFIGQVMRLTKGKANPAMVNEVTKRKLKAGE